MIEKMNKTTYKNLLALLACSTALSMTAFAQDAAQPTPPKINASFQEGMPYADMRKALLDAQWLPLSVSNCWENMGGQSQICNDLPEMESCSSDGHCVLNFANAKEQTQMRIGAYGAYDRWNQPQEQSSFAVKYWEFSPVKPEAPMACPSEDFPVFLQAFASDNAVKTAFTSPLVQVADLFESESQGYYSIDVYVPNDRYREFSLRYQDNAYHYQYDDMSDVDPDPLPLEITDVSANQKEVRFQYGMSEGNAYIFEHKNGCWFLTQDPQPPSP